MKRALMCIENDKLMVEISLKGQTILVTGALGAIATEVNRRLLQAGATLLLTDILEEAAAAEKIAACGYPTQHWAYRRMDVLDTGRVSTTIRELCESYPRIDTLIGLAGGCGMHPFATTAADEYTRIFNFNYQGQLNPTRAILREWETSGIPGHIIYTSSLVAGLPWVDLSAYISAKAAVEALSKCLALEYATRGIRFNCVSPGHVAAGSSQQVYETNEEYRTAVNRVIPLGRLIRPESIADMFLFLCSPMGQDINGQIIKIDGGASIPKVG